MLETFTGEKLGGGRGRAVITATSAMEYAFEGERLTGDQNPRPSVFTKALVDGLATGEADRDEDGRVSLNELYDYLFNKVREQNPHQTPSRVIEMEGELYIARSERQRLRAAPLPPELDAARKDQSMFTRRGAVGELRSRLLGDNLPAAAGAWEALTELANDIKFVADEAMAALSEATVRPAETELRSGQLVQGSPSPHWKVRLLGPPIARSCKADASHVWLHITETAEGFDISIDTDRVGTLKGSINFKGPTGEAVVTIKANVVPAPPETPVAKPDRDEIPAPKPYGWTVRPLNSRSGTRDLLIQLSHETHTLQIKVRYNQFVLLDGKTIIKAGGSGENHNFPISDGERSLTATLRWDGSGMFPNVIREITLIVDNHILYEEPHS